MERSLSVRSDRNVRSQLLRSDRNLPSHFDFDFVWWYNVCIQAGEMLNMKCCARAIFNPVQTPAAIKDIESCFT